MRAVINVLSALADRGANNMTWDSKLCVCILTFDMFFVAFTCMRVDPGSSSHSERGVAPIPHARVES